MFLNVFVEDVLVMGAEFKVIAVSSTAKDSLNSAKTNGYCLRLLKK